MMWDWVQAGLKSDYTLHCLFEQLPNLFFFVGHVQNAKG
jgi:hypothetical protein